MHAIAGCHDTGDLPTATMNSIPAQPMKITETALCFDCAGASLYGVLSLPVEPARRGVLIVVGGPQYRAGSHRQFTLLARDLAAAGIPVMRFDYRGMGDSEGAARSYDDIDVDLKAAIDIFFTSVPPLREVVLWGLCDGASAAVFYAPSDPRVTGIVMLNPWLRTDAGAARARLKYYYPLRLLDRELWRKVLQGRLNFLVSLRFFASQLLKSMHSQGARHGARRETLPVRMRKAFLKFDGKILLIISGNDLTAKEFLDAVAASSDWRNRLHSSTVSRHDLAAADHTFSKREWRNQVAAWTTAWLHSW